MQQTINKIKGKGKKDSVNFLEELKKEINKEIKEYHKITGDLPFLYHERQLNTILFPALYRISKSLFIEQPIKRKNRCGWIDYWIKYNNTNFILEIKHSFQNTRKNKIKKITKRRWKDSIIQITKINKRELRQDLITTRKLVRIAIMFLPFWLGSEDNKNLKNDYKLLKIDMEQIINQLKPKPNWTDLIKINEKMAIDKENKEAYSGLGIIAYVHPRKFYRKP